MNDKDRELLAHILQAGGSAAQQGFSALVRWQFIDGLAVFLTCLAVVVAGIFLFRMLWKWEPEPDQDDGFKHVARGGGMVLIVVVCCIVATNGLANGLRDMLAPEGAAVAWITACHR
jgi:hypothetical protein